MNSVFLNGFTETVNVLKNGQTLRKNYSDSDLKKVITYMKKKGTVGPVTPEIVHDPVTDRVIGAGRTVYSDGKIWKEGKFVWSDLEIYLLQTYEIPLNRDFLKQAIGAQ